jgi:hypothetical protein
MVGLLTFVKQWICCSVLHRTTCFNGWTISPSSIHECGSIRCFMLIFQMCTSQAKKCQKCCIPFKLVRSMRFKSMGVMKLLRPWVFYHLCLSSESGWSSIKWKEFGDAIWRILYHSPQEISLSFRRHLIVTFELKFYFLYGSGMKIGPVAQVALGTFSHFLYWLYLVPPRLITTTNFVSSVTQYLELSSQDKAK